MKRLTILILGIMAAVSALITQGCSNNDLYEDMPKEISQFISEYFPNSKIETFKASDTSYRVVIDDGPGLTFNSNYKWTSINGYGETLPQVLLFDQLPPELYEYLQGNTDLNEVFSITRNDEYYTVVLLDYTLVYDIATGNITGKG